MTLVLINLTLGADDITIWYCFAIEIRTSIALDLVVQMILLILNTLSCGVVIWSRSFINYLI